MALSANEHDLLVTTCGNMNTAAATCREVLEMLRSLGNTGVVDIAAHNNAVSVHTADTSIVRKTIVNENYTSLSLQSVAIPGISNSVYAVTMNIQPTGIQEFNYSILKKSTLASPSTTQAQYAKRIYLENDSDERISFESLTETPGYRTLNLEQFVVNDLIGVTKNIYVQHCLGRYAWHNDGLNWWKHTSISLSFCDGGSGSSVYAYEFTGKEIAPYTNSAINLGASGHAFKDLYLANQPSVGSDARLKKDVESLDGSAIAFVKALRPVGYKLIVSEEAREGADENGVPTGKVGVDKIGTRTHWGFLAQEVKDALAQAGIEDAAVWCLADKEDPDSQQSLRYDELLAPLVKAVQVLVAKVEALEAR